MVAVELLEQGSRAGRARVEGDTDGRTWIGRRMKGVKTNEMLCKFKLQRSTGGDGEEGAQRRFIKHFTKSKLSSKVQREVKKKNKNVGKINEGKRT